MMINGYSTSTIQDHMMRQTQADKSQLQGDIGVRNDHINQMMQDLKDGDMDGAKTEMLAARDAQLQVKSDRANLEQRHQDMQQLMSDFKARRQDIADFKDAMKSGDLEAAKQAFQAIGDMQQQIRTDMQALRPGHEPSPTVPAPSPAPLSVQA